MLKKIFLGTLILGILRSLYKVIDEIVSYQIIDWGSIFGILTVILITLIAYTIYQNRKSKDEYEDEDEDEDSI